MLLRVIMQKNVKKKHRKAGKAYRNTKKVSRLKRQVRKIVRSRKKR